MLRYKEDRRTVAFILFFMLQVIFGFVYFNVLPVWAKVALCLSICWFAFINATITHNTIHAPMFHSQWLNRLNQYFISVAYGHPVSSFVRGHNLSHHFNTQTPKDTMRTTKARFGWNLLNQLLFFFVVVLDVERMNKVYVRHMKTTNPTWYAQYQQEQWVVWLSYLAMAGLGYLCGLSVWGFVQAFLLFYMIPRLFGLWAITGMNYFQHDGCDENHPYNHSRNFVGRWTNWWMFNNGFHGIHHQYPGLHWSRLPARHAKEYAPHIHPALDQQSLLLYAWRAYIYPGRRLTYDGKPYTPPPAGEDIDWIPSPKETPKGASLGAVGSA